MGAQKAIVLPHLAGIGIGGVENGVITEPYGIVVICTLHLIFSAVLGAGGLLHSNKFAGDLGDYPENSKPQKFDFEWDDPDKLTFILGHHLIFLGLGAIMFVEWARIHGIYDPAIGSTRQVVYNLDIAAIWNHQFDFLKIDSLEDVMGGHAFLAFLEMIGGVFHICTKQFGEYTEFKGKGLLGAEAILSYSVVGVSYMAFVAAFWCASNTTIYPVDLYGEPLKLQFEFAPYFTDTVDLGSGAYSSRAWLANTHFYLGFFFLQGHLWHALRAMGFDFKKIGQAFDNIENTKITQN